MMYISKADKPYFEQYYRHLVGATIVAFGWSQEPGDLSPFPTFTVRKGDELFEIQILQDPEGNGPGFIFGLAAEVQ